MKRRGIKPSPGTLYPALKDLRERGYIQGEKQGRKVIYRLAEGARDEVDKACRYFCNIFADIVEEYGDKIP